MATASDLVVLRDDRRIRSMHVLMGAVRIRHSIREIATQPVILWILLGGRPKWLPLNFGFNDVMRTAPSRPRLLPYRLIVLAKLQDLRPSPSFATTVQTWWWEHQAVLACSNLSRYRVGPFWVLHLRSHSAALLACTPECWRRFWIFWAGNSKGVQTCLMASIRKCSIHQP